MIQANCNCNCNDCKNGVCECTENKCICRNCNCNCDCNDCKNGVCECTKNKCYCSNQHGGSYNKIINPITGRKVNVKSKLGQQIINNYINLLS